MTTEVAVKKELNAVEKEFFNYLKEARNVRLNDVQMQSVLHHGTQLLLAAPGTGKTTTTIAKIGYMIKVLNINPSKILAVTFSKAAAIDMQKRFKQMFPEYPDGIVHFSTIHSLAFEIYRDYMTRSNQAYQIIEGKTFQDKNGKKINLKKYVISNMYKQVKGEYPSEDTAESLAMYISLLKNLLLTPENLEAKGLDVDVVDGAAEVYEMYEEYKRAQNPVMIDYDDMLVEGLNIVSPKYKKIAHLHGTHDEWPAS